MHKDLQANTGKVLWGNPKMTCQDFARHCATNWQPTGNVLSDPLAIHCETVGNVVLAGLLAYLLAIYRGQPQDYLPNRLRYQK